MNRCTFDGSKKIAKCKMTKLSGFRCFYVITSRNTIQISLQPLSPSVGSAVVAHRHLDILQRDCSNWKLANVR